MSYFLITPRSSSVIAVVLGWGLVSITARLATTHSKETEKDREYLIRLKRKGMDPIFFVFLLERQSVGTRLGKRRVAGPSPRTECGLAAGEVPVRLLVVLCFLERTIKSVAN